MFLNGDPPVYPPVAKAARVTGTVVIKATISELGLVEVPQVVSGPPLLRKAALDSVRTWSYKPYKIDGMPVMFDTTINLIFKPDDVNDLVKKIPATRSQTQAAKEEKLGEDAYFRQAYDDALPHFEKAAGMNNKDAFSYLGYMYLWGRGVPIDLNQAQKWFSKSVSAGNEADKVVSRAVIGQASDQSTSVASSATNAAPAGQVLAMAPIADHSAGRNSNVVTASELLGGLGSKTRAATESKHNVSERNLHSLQTASNWRVTGNSVNGVAFDCTATSQTNIDSTQVASNVDALVKNEAGARMIMRYRFIVTSDQGHVFDSGPSGKQLASGATEHHQYSPFGKASSQDEFPANCQFTKVQVCPANVPVDWPKSPGAPYYDPFRDGPVAGCRDTVDLLPKLLPAPRRNATCAAFIAGYDPGKIAGFVPLYPFWATAPTREEAVSRVLTSVATGGKQLMSNSQPFTDCGHQHWAVAARRLVANVQIGNGYNYVPKAFPSGTWGFWAEMYGTTKADAEVKALNRCKPDVNNGDRIVIETGVTECELLASW